MNTLRSLIHRYQAVDGAPSPAQVDRELQMVGLKRRGTNEKEEDAHVSWLDAWKARKAPAEGPTESMSIPPAPPRAAPGGRASESSAACALSDREWSCMS